MNRRFWMTAAVMGGMAASAAAEAGAGPRLRHARKVHPRRDAHLKGAWRDPAWNEAEAGRANSRMSMERAAHKARKLEEGRERVAAGVHRIRKTADGRLVWGGGFSVTTWG